jgi:hypothetical protein
MKLWITLALALLPLSAGAQTSKPAKPKPDEKRAEAELLKKAQTKLQAFAAYDAYDIAERILANKPKHPLATRLRNAALVLGVNIDGMVVRVADKRITISVGSDDRVEKGLVVTLYRGKAAHAIARVVEVRRDSSVAEVFERKAALKAGDNATTSPNAWPWYRKGVMGKLPPTKNDRAFRDAVQAVERRRLYDVYSIARQAPGDPALARFLDAARLAQKVISGQVTVAGGEVQLDFGSAQGLRRFTLVTVTRKGKVVGTLRLGKVQADTASGRSLGGKFQTGDEASTDPALWPK